MNKTLTIILLICTVSFLSCKESASNKDIRQNADSSLVNTSHLDYLTVPITFANGTKASGIYIYAESPDYRFVTDTDEGFTCVDDVARAAQVYLRGKNFSSDTATHSKALN